MTEKKSRSAFIPVLAIVAVLMLVAVTLLTVVPLKTCGRQSPGRKTMQDARLDGTRFCLICVNQGKIIVWDLWGIQKRKRPILDSFPGPSLY